MFDADGSRLYTLTCEEASAGRPIILYPYYRHYPLIPYIRPWGAPRTIGRHRSVLIFARTT